MKQKRCNPRIITKNKSYPIRDSVFYKLSNKQRLSRILGVTLQELKSQKGDSNYHCFVQMTGGKPRQIQVPLGVLDRIHTRVASLLSRIEMPDRLHSGRKGRSNITNARAHLGLRRKLITIDIRDFYTNTKRAGVFDFFYNTMSCSPDVADLLSHVITYNGHIPTGSRVSMVMAYFANQRMFDEMETNAVKCGANMTVYVDDITISGNTLKKSFINKLESIAKKHGQSVRSSKSRFYEVNAVKLVTGTAVIRNTLKPRNKHLALLNTDMGSWRDNNKNNSSLKESIVGRMGYFGCIDSRYKDKARSFRCRAYTKRSSSNVVLS